MSRITEGSTTQDDTIEGNMVISYKNQAPSAEVQEFLNQPTQAHFEAITADVLEDLKGSWVSDSNRQKLFNDEAQTLAKIASRWGLKFDADTFTKRSLL